MFGTYEWVIVRGRILAGIHEADNKDVAEKVGAMVYRNLGDKKP